jgi:3-methyladenine DNA glycosylase/8-oxoguanine DNA glycosylase
MNERIKELLGQALDSAVPETWTALTPEQFTKVSEKFAELIVRECASKVTRNEALNIFEHFGVEE